MSATARGTTVLIVGDVEYTLKPTLDAVRKIEARFGGLRVALASLNDLSIAVVSDIIIAGAGIKPVPAKDVPQQVFEAGVGEIAPQLVPYLVFLINPSHKDASEAEAEGNGQTDEAES